MTRLAIIAAFLALGACATTGTAPPASDSAKAAAPAVSEDPAAQLAHVVELKANLGEGSNPPSLYRYLYAYQNPTVYVDPDGHCPIAMMNIDCYEMDAHMIGVDPYTKQGARAVVDFRAGQSRGSLKTIWGTVTGLAETAWNLVGSPIERASGGRWAKGTTESLGEQVAGTVEFVKHPIDTTVAGVKGTASEYSSALEEGRYQDAGAPFTVRRD